MRPKLARLIATLAPALVLASASAWGADASIWQSGELIFKTTTSAKNNGEQSRLEGSVQVQRELEGGKVQLEYAHRQERRDGNQCAMAGGGAGCVFDPLYRNGQNTDRLNVGGEFKVNDRLSTATSAQWQRGIADLNDTNIDRREVTRRVLDAKSEFQVSDHVALEANVKDQWDAGDEFRMRDLRNQWETLQTWRQLQAHWVPSNSGRMSIGWTASEDQNIRGEGRADDRRVAGWFAGGKVNVGDKFRLDGRVAQNDHSEFGKQDEAQVSVERKLTSGLELSTSARATYKVPSLYELNFPNRGDLGKTPERWQSLQTSLRGKLWSVDAAVHHVMPDHEAMPDSMKGIELGTSWKHGDTTVRANVVSFNVSASDGRQLPYRVRNSGRVTLDRDLGRSSVGLTVNAFSRRYLDDANDRAIDGYARIDLRTAFELTPRVRLDAGINNVFDRRTDTVGWYEQPGRQLQVNFRVNQ